MRIGHPYMLMKQQRGGDFRCLMEGAAKRAKQKGSSHSGGTGNRGPFSYSIVSLE